MGRSLCGRILVQLAPKYVRIYTNMPLGSRRAAERECAGSESCKCQRYNPELSKKASEIRAVSRSGKWYAKTIHKRIMPTSKPPERLKAAKSGAAEIQIVTSQRGRKIGK